MFEAILALIAAAITSAPEIIKDIENLIADSKKAASGGDPGLTPLAPQVTVDMADLEAKLTAKKAS